MQLHQQFQNRNFKDNAAPRENEKRKVLNQTLGCNKETKVRIALAGTGSRKAEQAPRKSLYSRC